MTAELDALSVDVVVPTYRRPHLLDRCLRALAAQQRSAERVLVVTRADDLDAHAVVRTHFDRLPGLERVTVVEPGVLAAMAAGIARSTGDVLAFTDDDAAPRSDWIAKLLAHLRDPAVGAVGGRDVIPGQERPLTHDVGRIRRSGRLSGLHHLGMGPARDVDVLKGVNMAFRAEAFALPAKGVLRGSGAQVDFEIVTCAWARRRGWRLVYDPSIQVDHEGAARSGSDQRVRPAPSAVAAAAFNSVVAASAVGGSALVRHAAYGLAVGTGDRPGLARALVGLARAEPQVRYRFGPAVAGRSAALVVLLVRHLAVSGLAMQTTGELREQGRARPRVTLVAHDVDDGGGMERAHAELVLALHKDFQLTVVSSTLAADLRPLVRWQRVRVPRRPFLAKYLTFFVLAGITLRRTDADVVHTVGAIVPNKADVATVHFCHAGYRATTGALTSKDAPPLRRINTGGARLVALWAERWCYRPDRLRMLAAVSNGVRREASEHFPGLPVTLTPNGVDPTRFRPDPQARVVLRQDLGVAQDTCVALFVGGDWDRKGLALALEGLAKARADGHDVVLWVVGPGDHARFASTARGLSVDAVTTFFGKRRDTERFYQAADLFVLPSAYETFSLVCFEAAACGLPLVIPAIAGAGELVGDDEAGIIIDREADSIARALRLLSVDRPQRRRLGDEARRRASQFTWDASTAAVADLYCDLVHARPAPNPAQPAASLRQRVATVIRESSRASSKGSDLASKLRLAGGPTAERALRHLPAQSRSQRLLRARVGSIEVSYRLNAGDIQGIREVLIDEVYRLPFSAHPRSIVDLGANIGLTSLFYADRLGDTCIVAVEPDPANASLARRNLHRVGVKVVEAAIAPEAGTIAFRSSGESNLGCVDPEGEVEVQAITMDQVLDLLPTGQADLVKIDIEGGEGALFSTNTSWLDRVGAIIIELHPQAVDVASIVQKIEAAGFRHIPASTVWTGSMDAFVRSAGPLNQ